MKAALISLESTSSKWTLKAMQKYFEEVDSLNLKNIEINLGAKASVLYDGKPIKDYDCIFAKGSFRYNTILRSVTAMLHDKCYMPIREDAFTIVHDKLLTQLIMEQKNIPMPKTYLASTPDAAKKILEKINYPIIMKFPEGTQGKGVMFADSYASASSMLDALTALKQPFLIQEYIETGSTDIRAIVIGNKVVASMKRKAVDGEKRANIHAGGLGEACTLDTYTKKIAVKAAETVGAEICAVDILEGAKGPVIIELNISPGLQGITKATNIDVADKIARYLFDQTKQKVESKKTIGAKEILDEISSPNGGSKEIFTNLDFRSNRVLLPEVATQISKFTEKDEVVLKIEEGKIVIMK